MTEHTNPFKKLYDILDRIVLYQTPSHSVPLAMPALWTRALGIPSNDFYISLDEAIQLTYVGERFLRENHAKNGDQHAGLLKRLRVLFFSDCRYPIASVPRVVHRRFLIVDAVGRQ